MVSSTEYREKRDKQNERQNQTLADLANRLFPEKEKSVAEIKGKASKTIKRTKKVS